MFDDIGIILFADYAEANKLRPNDPNTLPNPGMGRWFGRTTYTYLAGMPMADAIIKHRKEWRAALGLPIS